MASVPIVVQVIQILERVTKLIWKGAILLGDTHSLDVEPGDYVVQATLPSGETITEQRSVSGPDTVTVAVDVASASPRENLAWAQISRPEILESSSDARSSLQSVWLRLWRNGGDGVWNLVSWPVQQATRYQGIVQYEFSFLSQPGQYYVQIGGPEVPWRLVAVPADNVRVIVKGRWITQEADDPAQRRIDIEVDEKGSLTNNNANAPMQRCIDVEVGTLDTNAEVLIGYLRSGQIDSAQEVRRSWQAQKLLEQKRQNPTLAAVAGYFLLSLQHLDDVHRIWTDNLANWIKWLPDGAVINAQYLLRGNNEKDFTKARDRLIETTLRGMPVYTRGLRLLRDGLALFEDDERYVNPAVSSALKLVRSYCAAADWNSTTTAFVGPDPMTPVRIKVGRPETPRHVVFAEPDADDLAWLRMPERSWIRTSYGWTASTDVPARAASIESPPASVQVSTLEPLQVQSLALPPNSVVQGDPAEIERDRRVARGEEPEALSPATVSVAELPEPSPSPAAARKLARLRTTPRAGAQRSKDTDERIQGRLLRVANEQTESEQIAGTTPVRVNVGAESPAHLSGIAVERVLGKSDLLSTTFLERGVAAARAVVRISVRRNGHMVIATGFLVSPRLLMTAAHVIPTAEDAALAYAEFDYQDGPDGLLLPITRVPCAVDRFFFADARLDVAVVALHEDAGRHFGWLRLGASESKALVGEYLSTVGHPMGGPKQIALRELPIIDVGDPFFWCTSQTVPGSSGAPLFNDQWELVGMQHASSWSADAGRRAQARTSRTRAAETSRHLAIEAVRSSRIVKALTARGMEFPGDGTALIEELLYARPMVAPVVSAAPAQTIARPSVDLSPASDSVTQGKNQQGLVEKRVIMAQPSLSKLTPEKIANWLQNLERFDPDLAKSINARTAAMQPAARRTVGLEAAVAEAAPPLDVPIAIETMVRPGRPVVPIKGDTVVGAPAFIEPPDGEMMVQRLLAAADKIKPVIPLVGRIDVANFPRNASFIGTGWLIAPDIVVTNSHVAELIGRRDGRRFTFLPGRFGDPIVTTVNWKHEMDSDSSVASPVESIIFIESRQVADIAFLKIGRRSDGAQQDRVLLADTDAAAGTSVAVIGYPARAGEDVIPDQAWMERVFGGRYDVKRAAPGVVMPNSRGWATHDCTTLGGNSGSAVIDLATGKAVALHFAGAYVLENYAVPASTIRNYLKRRPWETPETILSDRGGGQAIGGVTQAPSPAAAAATGQAASVSITLPLTITVSIGTPVAGSGIAQAAAATETAPIEDAVRRFAAAFRGDGILTVRSGLVVSSGEFTDTACVNVVTHPDKIAAVRARVPATYLGHPVDVRTAGIVDMLGGPDLVSEAAVTSIAYNDEDRTGINFSFGQVNEEMELTCCVGPERSWSVLSDYIANAKGRMVSSMYEFHAEHIADAIQERLEKGIKMDLALDNATRVTRAGVGDGDFNRKTVFRKWARDFSFDRIYVPEGSNGLIADSYHIKVTVDDDDRFWLSSGNWKNSSQPNIDPADLNDLQAIRAKKGNREWHVVIKNKTLATRYRSHILADLEFSKENGGTEEAVVEDVLVDVPIAIEESVAFELEARAASRIFDPITINRRVKVKPLLTPDKKGKIYTDAVLDLIESADDELLFQVPYINSFKDSAAGNLEKLVKALIKKSREIDIVRIILRSDHGTWIPCAEDLKKRGLNLNKCLRHLPSTHTKGMIVDGKRCMVGSHNWSGNGVTLNRDASLLFDDSDVAQYYRQAFELDWDRASRPVIPESAITEAPRIADPESPVPQGFRRMTLEEFLEG
ncbi:trypsin-like peptidase domain-containing protein [Bradyrhizobium liaoningense]|uniref:trypsin-like peptidase domain-containing protein n=1 Tax=Bradyrhizobium liaoningense TaxID=43992 RepID=UPI001BAE3650|nr:trypsin-like peptidase domain-containing protein [Bradyrhizobium liaoningense]MBR1030332.1 trypsin-like peptidase domain-containing protein [Bradyrhizobium liaoningense]